MKCIYSTIPIYPSAFEEINVFGKIIAVVSWIEYSNLQANVFPKCDSVYFFPLEKKKNCTREQKLKKVAVKKKSAREKRKIPQKVPVKQNLYP